MSWIYPGGYRQAAHSFQAHLWTLYMRCEGCRCWPPIIIKIQCCNLLAILGRFNHTWFHLLYSIFHSEFLNTVTLWDHGYTCICPKGFYVVYTCVCRVCHKPKFYESHFFPFICTSAVNIFIKCMHVSVCFSSTRSIDIYSRQQESTCLIFVVFILWLEDLSWMINFPC